MNIFTFVVITVLVLFLLIVPFGIILPLTMITTWLYARRAKLTYPLKQRLTVNSIQIASYVLLMVAISLILLDLTQTRIGIFLIHGFAVIVSSIIGTFLLRKIAPFPAPHLLHLAMIVSLQVACVYLILLAVSPVILQSLQIQFAPPVAR